ncbi:MAG: outer membrane beta-barrel protein, partial [Flavobacteriales bacterium]
IGINAADVTGDAYNTFQKPGLYVGGGTYNTVYEKEKIHYRFGLFYSQKGSRKAPNPKTGDYTEYNLRLHYVEAPLQFDFLVRPGINANVGTTAGYLLSYREADQASVINAPVKFNKFEWAGHLGAGLLLGSFTELSFGYSYSILRVRSHFSNSSWYLNRGAHNSLFFLRLTRFIVRKREIPNDVDEN